MELVRAKTLMKWYGAGFRLGPVSLGLAPGEILGLMGPEGSGKTTLLKILWGFVRPDAGTARVFELTPHLDQVAVRLRAGYLSEVPKFYGWMTARKFLEFVSAFYDNWDRAFAIQQLLDFDVDPDSRIARTSKLNQRKLGLVAALGHRPALLLLDAVCQGLDPAPRHEIATLLKRLA